MGRRELGQAGEDLAASYLKSLGWRVLERNWRCQAGEVDIVAWDPAPPGGVVFCEVKCRRGVGFGPPLEAITAAKLAKLRELALHWLREQSPSVPSFRIDGIGVLLQPGREPEITHVRSIG